MFYYLKITLRKLFRDGIYSIINIGGLAIGMAAAIIIMLWVYHQWSYDRFHAKGKYLYKVWCYDEAYGGNYTNVSFSIGPSLLEEYTGFANMARYSETEMPFMPTGEAVDSLFFLTELSTITVATVDTSFLSMFSFPLLHGDASTALSDPYSMVITQRAAQRIFGDKEPMGKTISMFGALNFNITGILADLPDNTDFKFEVLIPYSRFDTDESWRGPPHNSNRSGSRTFTFVELSPGANVETVRTSIRDIVAKHTDGRINAETYLQHISDWHLYEFKKGISTSGLMNILRIFLWIALMILVIACINFINLRTAQSARYAKEVGVRKVFGAHRSSLIFRFLGESTIIAAIAGICAIYIVLLCLPFFNAIVGENLSIGFDNGIFWIILVLLILFTGVLAGSYPAFYLSSFLPIKVLKGIFKVGNGRVTPRKALIVTQFIFAVVLIASTLVIHRQTDYIQTRDTGYDMERLVWFQLTNKSRPTRELVRRELLESGVAESVSNNHVSMYEGGSWTGHLRWRGIEDSDNQIRFDRNYAEADWAKTTGVQIVQGRDIDIYTYPTDSTAMLLNETAVKIMEFDDPIGEIIYEWNIPYHVVGVVKDFVQDSPTDPVLPMTIGGSANGWIHVINVKLSAHGEFAENLRRAEQIYKKYNPDDVCLYRSMEEMYARRFDKIQRMVSLISWFTALAVFIACLGLFGLSAYMAQNRRKEIGIRKVSGATILDIISLLSKEFIVLMLISLVIALPIAWWLMNKWLAGFAYRTNLSWWIFVLAAVLVIGIALLTVGIQALRAAMANPVKAISKSE